MTTATKAATKTTTKTKTASTPTLIHCVDVGNSNVKYISAGQTEPKSYRSLYVEHTAGMQNKKQGTDDSPVVVLGGKSIHFGTMARKYQQPAAYLSGEDKTRSDAYIHAVLATFRPLPSGDTCYAVELRLSVPNYNRDAEFVAALFNGKKFTVYVNGVELFIEIKTVTVYREGFGSFKWAQGQGKLNKTGGYTLVVDVGGGTVVTMLIDSDGELVGDEAIFNGAGALQLAASVAGDYRLTSALDGSRAVPSLVMDAFQLGNIYGASGYDFTPWLSEYVSQWFKGIVSKLTTTYPTELMSGVGTILFCGGSIHLLPDALGTASPLYVVLDNPELTNIKGMAI